MKKFKQNRQYNRSTETVTKGKKIKGIIKDGEEAAGWIPHQPAPKKAPLIYKSPHPFFTKEQLENMKEQFGSMIPFADVRLEREKREKLKKAEQEKLRLAKEEARRKRQAHLDQYRNDDAW